MSKDGNGKVKVEKAGLKEVTREGFEYELTANLELDTRHNATASKDRTGLFSDRPAFIPSEETGALILEWCETGIEKPDYGKKLRECETLEDLQKLYTSLTTVEKATFLTIKDEMKEKLTIKTGEPA